MALRRPEQKIWPSSIERPSETLCAPDLRRADADPLCAAQEPSANSFSFSSPLSLRPVKTTLGLSFTLSDLHVQAGA